MNIALERVIEGIIATLRADVIPNVTDSYARGQAVGVIDLLNNIGPRLEWARAPILASLRERADLLAAVAPLLGARAPDVTTLPIESMSSAELLGEGDRLDAAIGDAIALAHARAAADPAAMEALGMLTRYLHEAATRDMKLTRKPLFAEIASGNT
jgi:hypothetical protein